MDVVAGDPVELRNLLSLRSNPSENQPSDEFENGIIEVFGPAAKRPRVSRLESEGVSFGEQPGIVSQFPVAVPEESSESTEVANPGAIRMITYSPTTIPQFETVPDVQSRLPASYSDDVAANALADQTNDGSPDDSVPDPHHEDEFRQITQDDDLDPQVFADITHQFERVAENSSTDDTFDQIDGHSWRDGVLMIKVRWKTDEVSTLPFTTVKNDYPREVADYVLKHKLGSSSGRYTGGHYTRWARQFNRNYDRIVRRMFRLVDGSEFDDDPNSPRTIRVSSHLPNGRRLIRRAIRAVPKTGGARKRKKPGRIS